MVLLRCFIGGTGEDPALHETDEAAVQTVLEDLHWILKFRAQPMFSRVFRWPRAMAQYNVGHPQRLADLKRQLAAFSRLHVAGNAYEGIGIPDCIRTGKQAAEQIIGLLSASQA
jgi:oxygen-dependent protoporphyrinogen oxidase